MPESYLGQFLFGLLFGFGFAIAQAIVSYITTRVRR